MNSFSNMIDNTKTISNAFQTKRDQETMNKYNNRFRDQNSALDSNLFERTYLVEENVQLPQVDYKDVKKEITIQSDKINILAQDENVQNINNITESNPIFHDGKLRQQQRSNRVREQGETDVALPGGQDQLEFQKKAVIENQKQAKLQAQLLKDQRVQFTEKPIDLEYSRKVDPDYHIYKQQIEKTQKIQYDLNDFQGKGVREHDPNKRMFVAAKVEPQLQKNQNMAIEQKEIVVSKPKNNLQENIKINNIPIIAYKDVNVEKMIQIPKNIRNFVQLNNDTKITQSTNQAVQSLEQIMPKQNSIIPNIQQTFITKVRHVFAPKPQLAQDTYRQFINCAQNNFITSTNQVTSATDLRPVNTNHPGIAQMAMQNHFSSLRGPFEGIYFGEQ